MENGPWCNELSKDARRHGKQYLSRIGKKVKEKHIGPECKCHKMCFEEVTKPVRESLFKEYYSLPSYEAQSKYLYNLMNITQPSTRRETTLRPRERAVKYVLSGNVTICKKAFMSIFGISHARIMKIFQDAERGEFKDGRGKYTTPNRIILTDDEVEDVKKFLKLKLNVGCIDFSGSNGFISYHRLASAYKRYADHSRVSTAHMQSIWYNTFGNLSWAEAIKQFKGVNFGGLDQPGNSQFIDKGVKEEVQEEANKNLCDENEIPNKKTRNNINLIKDINYDESASELSVKINSDSDNSNVTLETVSKAKKRKCFTKEKQVITPMEENVFLKDDTFNENESIISEHHFNNHNEPTESLMKKKKHNMPEEGTSHVTLTSCSAKPKNDKQLKVRHDNCNEIEEDIIDSSDEPNESLRIKNGKINNISTDEGTSHVTLTSCPAKPKNGKQLKVRHDNCNEIEENSSDEPNESLRTNKRKKNNISTDEGTSHVTLTSCTAKLKNGKQPKVRHDNCNEIEENSSDEPNESLRTNKRKKNNISTDEGTSHVTLTSCTAKLKNGKQPKVRHDNCNEIEENSSDEPNESLRTNKRKKNNISTDEGTSHVTLTSCTAKLKNDKQLKVRHDNCNEIEEVIIDSSDERKESLKTKKRKKHNISTSSVTLPNGPCDYIYVRLKDSNENCYGTQADSNYSCEIKDFTNENKIDEANLRASKKKRKRKDKISGLEQISKEDMLSKNHETDDQIQGDINNYMFGKKEKKRCNNNVTESSRKKNKLKNPEGGTSHFTLPSSSAKLKLHDDNCNGIHVDNNSSNEIHDFYNQKNGEDPAEALRKKKAKKHKITEEVTLAVALTNSSDKLTNKRQLKVSSVIQADSNSNEIHNFNNQENGDDPFKTSRKKKAKKHKIIEEVTLPVAITSCSDKLTNDRQLKVSNVIQADSNSSTEIHNFNNQKNGDDPANALRKKKAKKHKITEEVALPVAITNSSDKLTNKQLKVSSVIQADSNSSSEIHNFNNQKNGDDPAKALRKKKAKKHKIAEAVTLPVAITSCSDKLTDDRQLKVSNGNCYGIQANSNDSSEICDLPNVNNIDKANVCVSKKKVKPRDKIRGLEQFFKDIRSKSPLESDDEIKGDKNNIKINTSYNVKKGKKTRNNVVESTSQDTVKYVTNNSIEFNEKTLDIFHEQTVASTKKRRRKDKILELDEPEEDIQYKKHTFSEPLKKKSRKHKNRIAGDSTDEI